MRSCALNKAAMVAPPLAWKKKNHPSDHVVLHLGGPSQGRIDHVPPRSGNAVRPAVGKGMKPSTGDVGDWQVIASKKYGMKGDSSLNPGMFSQSEPQIKGEIIADRTSIIEGSLLSDTRLPLDKDDHDP
ncbi:hypothetical protein Dimus_026180 [Dionaea muscipula]